MKKMLLLYSRANVIETVTTITMEPKSSKHSFSGKYAHFEGGIWGRLGMIWS